MSKLKNFILGILDTQEAKIEETPQSDKGTHTLDISSVEVGEAVAEPVQQPGASASSWPIKEEKTSPLLAEDNIATCHKVLKAVLHHLSPYLGVDASTPLVVYIPDQTLFTALKMGGFNSMLESELAQAGHNFSSLKVINDEPPVDRGLKLVCDSFYCDVEQQNPPVRSGLSAEITLAENCGKLLQPRYLIPCKDGILYNIGRSSTNDIAFDPDTLDPLYKLFTGYVRSKHAYIKVVEGNYYLYAYLDGTRSQGSRTQIFHPNENITEEVEVNAPRRLRSGDIIVLGKKAKLLITIK